MKRWLLLLIASPAHAGPTATFYLDTNVAGDVDPTRGGAGASVGYYRGGFGVELDVAFQGHFFDDDKLMGTVPEGVDLNTRAITAIASVVVPVPIPNAPIWLPYASGGIGVVRGIFDANGADELSHAQNDLSASLAIGIKHRLTELVGLQVEGRYFRVFADDQATVNRDYDIWRISVGVTFGFPR